MDQNYQNNLISFHATNIKIVNVRHLYSHINLLSARNYYLVFNKLTIVTRGTNALGYVLNTLNEFQHLIFTTCVFYSLIEKC